MGSKKNTKKQKTREVLGISSDSPVISHVVLVPTDRRDVRVTGSYSAAIHFQEMMAKVSRGLHGRDVCRTPERSGQRYHSVQKTYRLRPDWNWDRTFLSFFFSFFPPQQVETSPSTWPLLLTSYYS